MLHSVHYALVNFPAFSNEWGYKLVFFLGKVGETALKLVKLSLVLIQVNLKSKYHGQTEPLALIFRLSALPALLSACALLANLASGVLAHPSG